jgi:hypothetical protein
VKLTGRAGGWEIRDQDSGDDRNDCNVVFNEKKKNNLLLACVVFAYFLFLFAYLLGY